MRIHHDDNSITVRTFFYGVEINPDRFRLLDPRTEHVLIDCPTPLIYRPMQSGGKTEWAVTDRRVHATESGPCRVVIDAMGSHGLRLSNVLTCCEEHVEIGASLEAATTDTAISYWDIFAPGTAVNMFHVHHWRNRHGHTATYETYNLTQGERCGDEFDDVLRPEMRDQWTKLTELTTYSTDWQFTPHPSFLLMQRDSVMLGIGARDLPQGFGLEMRSAAAKLHHLRFNYGGAEHGLIVPSGVSADGPRFYVRLDHGQSIWDSVDHYVGLLRQDGAVTQRQWTQAPHWWTRPMYCTWQDQCYLSGQPALYSWMGETFDGAGPAESFTTQMLDYLLDRIEAERLPVGSILIDDGWQTARGEWRADPKRFPDLRKRIDRIHSLGMKALLWIAPLDFWEGASVLEQPDLLCGGGILSRFGSPLVDYSNPSAQEQYVLPMMRYLFSSEADCLDADGFKSDFMAEKVQACLPVFDPSWRGEEPFILKTMGLFCREMRSYRPDAMHLGCTAHPSFGHVQDVIRTYDVPSSQLQHADRATMIRHFCPGSMISLDLGECRSLADIEQHIDIAYANNLLYQLPRIAAQPNGDHPLGPDFFPLIRQKLRAWS